MAEGKIHFAERDGTCVIRCSGEIRYTLGHALDVFLDRLFERGGFDHILVDLSETESIDSTGLGLLAKIANFIRQRDQRKPLLFVARADIVELLTSLCLDEVFVLCDAIPDLGRGEVLQSTDPSAAELAHTVLEAHRLLAAMNNDNRAQFQSVVDGLTVELSKP